MSAASSLKILLAPHAHERNQDIPSKDALKVHSVIPLFTRLLHAHDVREMNTSRVEMQNLLFDQSDATLGKEYAREFQNVSLDDIRKKNDDLDLSTYPDNGDIHARIEWVIGTLLRAIASNERGEGETWSSFANHSHVLEIQIILSHALARDWIPLPQLAIVLSKSSIGATLLLGIVQNDPSAFSLVVEAILMTMRIVDADHASIAYSILVSLGTLSLSNAMNIRTKCLQSDLQYTAAIAIELTCQHINDVSLFLSSTMQGANNSTLWMLITEGISSQDASSPFRTKVIELVGTIRSLLLVQLKSAMTTSALQFLGVLKAYCGLIGRGGAILTDDECSHIFQAIRFHLPRGKGRFIELSFITITMICLSKLVPQEDTSLRIATEARSLISGLYDADTSHSGSLFTMMALLLYTKPSMVVDLIRSVLDSVVLIQQDRISFFGECVIKPGFTEPIMIRGLLQMVPTQDINAVVYEPQREMTLRVAYSLLCERSYARHKVNPTEWILRQIDAATLPIHPILPNLMVELVENHVAAYDMTTQKSNIPPIRSNVVAETVLAVVDKADYIVHPQIWTRAVLLLVYALHYNRRYLKDATARKYDLHTLPVSMIFHTIVRSSHVGGAFEFAYPVVVRLIMDECAYVLLPCNELDGAHRMSVALEYNYSHLLKREATLNDMAQVRELLRELNLVPIKQSVGWLSWLASSALPIAIGALESNCSSLFSQPNDMLALPTTQLSHPEVIGLMEPILTRVMPYHHAPDTITLAIANSLCASSAYSYSQLLEEPFLILRCDPRVWRNGALLRLLLLCLSRYRDLSAIHLRQLNTEDSIHSTMDSTQFILVQDSIIIHALLNVLQRLQAEDAQPQSRLLFEWLEEAFRTSPTLLLTVHSQGYDLSLIPLLVKQLPSLYDLTPSVPDLLSSNDLTKLSFRCHLAAALFHHYPDTVLMPVLKSVIAKVKLVFDTDRSQTSDKVVSSDVIEFLVSVLPALGNIAVSFCDAADDCVQLLMKLRVQVNNQASDTSNSNASLRQLDSCVHRVFAQIIRSSRE